MSDRINTALSLGCYCLNMETFVQECDSCPDQQLGQDLKEVGNTLVRLSGSEYESYVMMDVLPNKLRRAFYFCQPIDNYLIGLRTKETVHSAGEIYLLIEVVNYGANCARIAAALMPTLTAILPHTPFVKEICSMLKHLVHHDHHVESMLHCDRFMENLARRIQHSTCKHITDVVIEANLYDQASLIHPIMRECFRLLSSELAHVHHRLCEEEGVDASLNFVTLCASKRAWYSMLIPHVIDLSRNGWLSVLGLLLMNMFSVSSSSIEFIVRLHHSGKLQSLIRAAYEFHSVYINEWNAIRGYLEKQWPTQVAFVMNIDITDRKSSVSSCDICCPITLHPCIYPVVASDGHTYDRDAIMKHITTLGMISPTTKQHLEYHLFVNYAALRGA